MYRTCWECERAEQNLSVFSVLLRAPKLSHLLFFLPRVYFVNNKFFCLSVFFLT